MPKALLACALLLAASLACGSSNAAVLIGTQTPNPLAAPTSASLPSTIYRVGEMIQFSGHTIVMNQAQLSGGVLQTNITVENTGSQDVNVSSILQFDARLLDGTKLVQELFNCPAGRMDGKVLPGDKLKGNLCWKGVATDTARVYYVPNLFGSGAAVWEVQR